MNDRFKAAMPVVVSIAGSDCSGGAGIQADIKTCSALGVYCPTAVTAVTAQNPGGVKAAEYVGDRMMRLQLRAIFDSITPDAVKIGMLPCADAVRVIYDTAAEYDLKNIVIDPVLSATSGGSLSGETETTSDAAKSCCSHWRFLSHRIYRNFSGFPELIQDPTSVRPQCHSYRTALSKIFLSREAT